jgi:anti-anti-sigma factor
MLTSPDGDSGQQLEWQTEATAAAIILHLSGEVDLATVPKVSSTLKILAEGGYDVIVDLNCLRYIDSTGFKAILDANSLFLRKAQRLVLSAPSDFISQSH